MRSPANTGIDDASNWLALAVVVLVAFALRMAIAVLLPGIHYPDEVMQSLEQAHRLVFGSGLVPWEFRDGARSWLLPGMLAVPMWLGNEVAPGSGAYRWLAQALIAAITASSAAVGYVWAKRYGRWPALVAAIVLCTWFEFVYFGARALGEVVAAALLFAGVFLCSRHESPSTRRAAMAGFCLGSAFVFRFHLAPALALAALWYCRADVRQRWLPLLAGASLPLLALGLADWIAWSQPFASILNNFRANILEGRSHVYGTSGAGWYVSQLAQQWGLLFPVVLLLAAGGARREPLALLTALAIVLAHSVVAHKEYRFIYPALPLVLLLAALGSAELCGWIARWRKQAENHAAMLVVACLAWIAGSIGLAVSPAMHFEWTRGRAGVELMARAGTEAHCGVGLLAAWSWTGGYSSLHRALPIYLLDWDRNTWNTEAFDAWILPGGVLEPQRAGYRLVQCGPQNAAGATDLCLWVRGGECDDSNATNEAQRVLNASGQ